MSLALRSALLLGALALLAACEDESPPPPLGFDAGPMDAGCAPCEPPEGCRFEMASGCECGVLVCDDAGGTDTDAGDVDAGPPPPPEDAGTEVFDGCVDPECPEPPAGCAYRDATPCTCGVLTCDGLCGGVECASDEYCAYSVPESCGGDGMCRSRPSTCPGPDMPVCGCDTISYRNECEAHMTGTDVAFPGDCPPVVDCRGASCAPGETCTDCSGTWVCLPAGAPC